MDLTFNLVEFFLKNYQLVLKFVNSSLSITFFNLIITLTCNATTTTTLEISTVQDNGYNFN